MNTERGKVYAYKKENVMLTKCDTADQEQEKSLFSQLLTKYLKLSSACD